MFVFTAAQAVCVAWGAGTARYSRSSRAMLANRRLTPCPAKATVTSSSPPVGLVMTTTPSPKLGWRTRSPALKPTAPDADGGAGGVRPPMGRDGAGRLGG